MHDLAPSFDGAWASFQARAELQLVGETLEWEWTRGRAQYLTFLVRVEDAASRDYIAGVIERLGEIPGVEPYPEWYWHATVKGGGFQVIKRTRDDDIARQAVPRIAGKARALLAREATFGAQLGLANGFGEVVFIELHDGGGIRRLNALLADGVAELPRYPIDGDGFLPHVSIARFTSNDGLEELKEALTQLRTEEQGPLLPVRRVDFVKAWLTEAMPEFETLASYALSGRAAPRGAR